MPRPGRKNHGGSTFSSCAAALRTWWLNGPLRRLGSSRWHEDAFLQEWSRARSMSDGRADTISSPSGQRDDSREKEAATTRSLQSRRGFPDVVNVFYTPMLRLRMGPPAAARFFHVLGGEEQKKRRAHAVAVTATPPTRAGEGALKVMTKPCGNPDDAWVPDRTSVLFAIYPSRGRTPYCASIARTTALPRDGFVHGIHCRVFRVALIGGRRCRDELILPVPVSCAPSNQTDGLGSSGQCSSGSEFHPAIPGPLFPSIFVGRPSPE